MGQVTINQRLMAKREFGVKLSKESTEKDAIKVLKRVSDKFRNKKLWDNKIK